MVNVETNDFELMLLLIATIGKESSSIQKRENEYC